MRRAAGSLVDKRRFVASLCFQLRAASALIITSIYILNVLHQCNKHTRRLLSARKTLRKVHGVKPSKTSYWRAQVSGFVISAHLFGAIPRLVGQASRELAARLHAAHNEFQRVSYNSPLDRVQLNPELAASRLQEKFITEIFLVTFQLRLGDQQVALFARYVDVGDLILDFLDHCMSAGGSTGTISQAMLFELSRSFTQRLKEHLETKGSLPQRGFFRQMLGSSRKLIRHLSNVNLAAEIYDHDENHRRRLNQILPTEYHGLTEMHTTQLRWLRPKTYRETVRHEIHSLYCIELTNLFAPYLRSSTGSNSALSRAYSTETDNLLKLLRSSMNSEPATG